MEASNQSEMQPTNLEASVAVMTVEMRYVRAGIEDLKVGMNRAVSRTEWEQRNGHVDERFAGLDRELGARKVPWTSVGALIISGAVLLLSLIERMGVS